MANTLAYYNTATITAIKSFIVQTPEDVLEKFNRKTKYLLHYIYKIKDVTTFYRMTKTCGHFSQFLSLSVPVTAEVELKPSTLG